MIVLSVMITVDMVAVLVGMVVVAVTMTAATFVAVKFAATLLFVVVIPTEAWTRVATKLHEATLVRVKTRAPLVTTTEECVTSVFCF